MLQELRFAHRALLRSPGYVGAAVVTLALGIGVNIAVASFAWSVLLRPLPIAEPDRVVMIYPANSALERVRQPIAFVKFREWRAPIASSKTSPCRPRSRFSWPTRTATRLRRPL